LTCFDSGRFADADISQELLYALLVGYRREPQGIMGKQEEN